MSNTVELKKYGGQKPVELEFRDVERRLLLAIMEYNHETYGGDKIAPIAVWRNALDKVSHNRLPLRESRHVFLDFLPSDERELTRKGINFERCAYRGSELTKFRYDRVRKVRFHYDPRDMRRIYIPVPDERQYVTVERVEPRNAPLDLYLIKLLNKHRRARAESSRDAALLAEIEALKTSRRSFGFVELAAAIKSGAYDQSFPPASVHSQKLPAIQSVPATTDRSAPDVVDPPPPLQIPDFPSRLK